MADAREQRSVVRWTALVFAIGALLYGAFVFLLPHPGHDHDLVEDTFNVKQMVAEVMVAPTIHATDDGRIDVYRTIFASIELTADNVALLRHVRSGVGPTIADVRAGDYSRFVWERAKAEDVRGATERIPVVWDPRPFDGKRVVGFASGHVKILPEEDFAALRR